MLLRHFKSLSLSATVKSVQQTTKGPAAQAQPVVRLFALFLSVICLAKSFPGYPDSENLVSLLWRPL